SACGGGGCESQVQSRAESIIAAALAYWALPVTLLLFWARYLTIHDLHGTTLHCLLIASAVALAVVCPGFSFVPGSETVLSGVETYSIASEDVSPALSGTNSSSERRLAFMRRLSATV